MEITNKNEKKCKIIEEIFNIAKSISNSDIGIYLSTEHNVRSDSYDNNKYIFCFYTNSSSRLSINTALILNEDDISCYYIHAGRNKMDKVYRVKLSELERFIITELIINTNE